MIVLDVTLSRVTQSGDPSPCVRDPCRDLACMCQTKRRPESIVHEQRAIVHGVVRLGSADLPVVPDNVPSLLELLHLRGLYFWRYSVYTYIHTHVRARRAESCIKIANCENTAV